MAAVDFEQVSKIYPDGTTAVSHFDLDVPDGEFMVLVGPSGCGKTTALRMVAGLEDISRGVIRIGERVVNYVPSRDRDIAMVFQSYALYPHLSVYENIAFGLRLKKVPKAEIDRRVQDAARILDLEPFLKRKPRELSGGQRQRVAMGRAIVREPQAFLMDEPLSNLDAKLRVQMRAEISRPPARPRRDDDLRHARPGRGDDDGRPRRGDAEGGAAAGRRRRRTLYDRPVNLFVGGFIGSPGDEHGRGDDRARRTATLVARARRPDARARRGDARGAARRFGRYAGKTVILGIRPEDLEEPRSRRDAAATGGCAGTVKLREALGSEIMVHFTVDGEAGRDRGRDRARRGRRRRPPCRASRSDRRRRRSSAASAPRSRVAEGEPVDVAVDTRTLHFFDPETALGIYDEQHEKGAS